MDRLSYCTWDDRCDISVLIGRRIVRITGAKEGSELVEFHCEDGKIFGMFHDQDCCESVDLFELDGDPQRTIGLVTSARCEESSDRPAVSTWDESHTWTFYIIETEGGTLHLRWYGTSNGHYSESVSVYLKTKLFAAAQGVEP